MVRWCRIVVLVVVGFYAVAGGLISSPLAAAGAGTGTDCVGFAAGTDDCPSGCDAACPAALCIVSPYVAPLPAPTAAARTVRRIDYVAARPERLASRAPDPALRPPNA